MPPKDQDKQAKENQKEQQPQKLQPWQEKALGRKNYFEDTWSYYFGELFDELFDVRENANKVVEYGLEYIGNNLSPEVTQPELYGKKMPRPWGVVSGGVYSLVSQAIKSTYAQNMAKGILDSKINVNAKRYFSGAQVATELFTPSLMAPDKRSTCHFADALMDEFQNEVGFPFDEQSIIVDMMQETMKIADGNFNDSQWRKDVIPTLLAGSYQKNLGIVFSMLREDAANDPSITPADLDKKMNKAQECLGKLYKDFSTRIANTTNFLEAPLEIFDTDVKQNIPEDSENPLTDDEKEAFKTIKQGSLIKQADFQRMKKQSLSTMPKPSINDAVMNFYRSCNRTVGPVEYRSPKPTINASIYKSENYAPTPQDRRSFMAAATSLRMMSDELSKLSKSSKKYQDYIGTLSVMKEDMKVYFQVKDSDINWILDKNNKIGDLQQHMGFSDDEIRMAPKVEVRPMTDPTVSDNGVLNAIKNSFPTTESVKEFITNTPQMALDAGKYVANKAIDLINGTGSLVKGAYEYFTKDDPDKEKNKALDALPAWQQKMLGHKDRYTDSWMGSVISKVNKKFGGSIDTAIDGMFETMEKSMNPEVKTYEVYGKKLNKPWGLKGQMIGAVNVALVDSSYVKGTIKDVIKRKMMAPGTVQYTSGQEVVVSCFSPSYMQGEMRPPCHFNKAHMAEFFNATGIVPDERGIIADMAEQCLNVKDYNYTDKQWREMLMPQIIKGSYEKQLQQTFEIMQNEYAKNPAMTKEFLNQRMHQAADALGKMYSGLTKAIANTTEYLDAPMVFKAGEKLEPLSAEAKSFMTPEQIKAFESYKPEVIASDSKVNELIDKAGKAAEAQRRPEKPGELLEDFIRIKCGIGPEGGMPIQIQKFDDPQRSPETDQALLGCIVTYQKIEKQLNSHNFFGKLFKKKTVADEKRVRDFMLESMGNDFGLNAEQIKMIGDSKLSIDQIRQNLGISEDALLGYKRIEVPDEKAMEKEGTSYADKAANFVMGTASAIKSGLETGAKIVKVGYKAVKVLGKAGYRLAERGIKKGIDLAGKAITKGYELGEAGLNIVMDVAEKTVETVTEVTNTVMEKGKEAIDATINTVSEVANTVVETGKDVINSTVDTVSEVANTVVETTKDVIDATINTVSEVANTVVETGKDIVNTVVETGTNVVNATVDTVSSVANTVAETTMDVINSTVDTVSEVANTVAETTMEVVNAGYETVKNVAVFGYNVAYDGATYVANQIYAVGSSLYNWYYGENDTSNPQQVQENVDKMPEPKLELVENQPIPEEVKQEEKLETIAEEDEEFYEVEDDTIPQQTNEEPQPEVKENIEPEVKEEEEEYQDPLSEEELQKANEEAQPEVVEEAQPETKENIEPEVKEEAKPEETQPEVKEEAQPEEAQPEVKEEAQPEVKEAPKPKEDSPELDDDDEYEVAAEKFPWEAEESLKQKESQPEIDSDIAKNMEEFEEVDPDDMLKDDEEEYQDPISEEELQKVNEEPQPEVKEDAQPEVKENIEPEVKEEAKPEEAQPEVKENIEPEVKEEAKPEEPKPEVKEDAQLNDDDEFEEAVEEFPWETEERLKKEAQSETKVNTEPEVIEDAQPEVKEETKPEEPQPEVKEEAQPEVKEAPKSEEAKPEEAPELDDDKPEISYDQAVEELDNVIGEVKEAEEAGFLWRAIGYGHRTAEQLVKDLNTKEAEIMKDMMVNDIDDGVAMFSNMSKLALCEEAKMALAGSKWKPSQVEELLKPEVFDAKAKELGKSEMFHQACRETIKDCRNIDDILEIPNLASELYGNIIEAAKKQKRAAIKQEQLQKKNQQKEKVDEGPAIQ